jgi:hypothetical protein
MTSLTSPIEEGEHLALGTFKMPKLRDVCRKDKSFLKDLKADELIGNRIAACGVIRR